MYMCVSLWVHFSPLLLRPVLPCLLLFLPPPALRAAHWARQPDRHAKPAQVREQGEWRLLRRLRLPHRLRAQLRGLQRAQRLFMFFSYIIPSIGFGVSRNTHSAHSKFSEINQAEKMVDRTGKPVGESSSNAQIRTLLDEQRQMIIAEYFEKIGHHELQAARAGEERRILQEELWRQQ